MALIGYQLNAMAMAFYLGNVATAKAIATADSSFRYDNEINKKGQVFRELGDSGSYGCAYVPRPPYSAPSLGF